MGGGNGCKSEKAALIHAISTLLEEIILKLSVVLEDESIVKGDAVASDEPDEFEEFWRAEVEAFALEFSPETDPEDHGGEV